MKISFIINEPLRVASGGYKMVYLYANALVKNGDRVTIYYRCRKQHLLSHYRIPSFVKLLIAQYRVFTGPSWYRLDKRVKCKIIERIDNRTVQKGDAVIATAADTAYDVSRLSLDCGKKFYFIQGYETWSMPEDQLQETYRSNMQKIAVSKWLKEKVETVSGQNVDCVLNGIDSKQFFISVKPEDRVRTQICMLFSELESKGSLDGLKVLIRLKEKYPELEAQLFGTVRNPAGIPQWIKHKYNASSMELQKIYNDSIIFISPCWNEGFGLTGAEAMMCGCALVASKTDGTLEYANENNAVLVEARNTDALYQECCRLLDNPDQRIELAKKGSEEVSKLLNIDEAAKKIIKIIHGEK